MKISNFTITVIVSSLLFLLCLFSPSRGQIYRWVDQSGVTHFTDNPQNIPNDQKNSAEVFTPPQITTYTEQEIGEVSVSSPGRDEMKESVQGRAESIEDLRGSIVTLKSQIKAKRDLVKYVDDRRNLAINPLRNRIITEKELALYDRYIQELPEDELELENLESTLRMMEKSGSQ